MIILLKKLFILLLFFGFSLSADTMFLLTKIDKAYLVVENYSTKVSNNIKKEILSEMKDISDELEIDTSGYSYRTLAFIIYETYLDDNLVINIDLILGEEIQRLDDKEEVYAFTYKSSKQFISNNKEKEEIEEEILDNIDILLSAFLKQYEEDNK